MEIWKQHYEEKFKENKQGTNEMRVEPTGNEGNDDIKIIEVKEAIKNIKVGKAEGRDKITPEFIKYGGETLQPEILKICNKI